jgi:UDP-N-acetylglucosamine 2-epimerase
LEDRFRRFITGENIERTDPQVLHCRYRIIVPFKEVVNQLTYRYLKKFRFSFIENKKYIFFGFHKQPEASIDVCGRYFENQFETVINIWRQLPPKWLLAVKEHSNAIGDRGYSFFKKICQYPNIVIIDEKEDSHRIIQNAQLIITNTGTMALEAALMNIPAITLSTVFFNRLNYCRHCNWQDLEKYNSITDLINEIKRQPNNIEEYTKYIMENSFEGSYTALITTNPAVYLTDDNIRKFVCAVKEIINFDA